MADLNRKQGQTIIIATHSRKADALASRIIKLKDGKIPPDIEKTLSMLIY